jgi:hypothetical protein
MNKSLCKEIKKRGKFHWGYCAMCSYSDKCIELEEHKNGHADELRDATAEAIEDNHTRNREEPEVSYE